jgi:ribosomal protein S2
VNIYSINLGHARPELERSIAFFSHYKGPQGSIMDKTFKDAFKETVKNIVAKEGADYFVKSMVREPFLIRRFK